MRITTSRTEKRINRPVINNTPFGLNKKEFIMLAISAALMGCAFENINLDIFVWIAFIPFLAVISKKTPKDAFKAGFVAGMIFYLITIYWLVYTISHYGKINVVLSFAIFLLLVLYLALFFASFAFLYRYLKTRVDTLFLAPIIWVALEYLRTYLLSGFPWVLLGYSVYKRPMLTQFADITGVYGQSFLIVLVNAVFYSMYEYFKGNMGRKRIREASFAYAIIGLVVFYGVTTLKDGIKEPAKTVKVALTQGNIDQDIKWNTSYRRKTMELYTDLSFSAIKKINDGSAKGAPPIPTLVVWPETAAPFYMQSEKNYRDELLGIAKDANTHILTGGLAFEITPEQDEDDDDYLLYNSAYLISPEKGILGRYDKNHLVPFGEYVPLSKILFFVNKLTQGIGDFDSGSDETVLTMNDSGIGLGTLICYEAIFPNLARNFAKNGANILVNITNDAWFGRTSAPYQHLSMTAFRAVENKRYVIRAANTGISGIIDPFGRVVKKSGIFEQAVITGQIKAIEKMTFYSRHGDLFSQTVSMILLILLLVAYRKRIPLEP